MKANALKERNINLNVSRIVINMGLRYNFCCKVLQK